MNALLLATEPIGGHPGFIENLIYQSVGIMVVLTSLGTLWLCVGLLGRALVPSPAPRAAGPHPAPAAPADETAIAPEVRAAITAAIYDTVGPGHEIHAIHPVNPLVQAWSVEGRRQIFQSHTPR